MEEKKKCELIAGIMETLEEEIPIENQFTAADNFIERQKSIFARNKELSTTLNQLQEDCLRDIHSLIGPKKLERYSAFHGEIMGRMVELPELFTLAEERDKLEQEYRGRLLAKAREFVGSLDIDISKVKSIQKEYIARAQSAIEKVLELEEEAPYVHISPAEVPKLTSNPWTWKYPPYNGDWGTAWSSGSRGRRWVGHAENRLTGEIHCWNRMYIYGADDSDYSRTDALSEIWVWFRMPAAGMVEAWIYLQDIDTPYSGCLEDEWGWSDASIRQQSSAYLEVFNPPGARRYGSLLNYTLGECDCCWARNITDPGKFRYAHLYSKESYAAGQWGLMAIGIHDHNYFWVNDMSCDTRMTSRWFVHHLALRSTGAP